MNCESDRKTVEQGLIESIQQWTGGKYIGDDCAVLPGQNLVTSDTLVEGTHFDLSLVSPADLGWKAVAVNLSDIAAMAGRPRHLIVNLTLPPAFRKNYFRELFQSIFDCARSFKTAIAGGDLTRGRLLSITLTVLGEAHEAGCLKRSGALAGDVVAVTGSFGASAAGLWVLSNGVAGYRNLVEAHLRPSPRLCESWALVKLTGNRGALMDASDGLADALIQIGRASGVAMEIDPEAVPIDPETREAARLASVEALDWALYGGEDYQLVATIPKSVWETMRQSAQNCFTAIGRVVAGRGIIMQGQKKEALDLSKSFQHWDDIS